MEVNATHKQTEAGLIPVDWSVNKLVELGSFKNGINKGSESFGHGSPFVNLMDVFGYNFISTSEHLGLVRSNKAEQDLYSLKEGDVLFIRSSVKPSGVGLTALILNDLVETVFSGFLIRFRDKGKLSKSFKKYCFYQEDFRSRVISASSVSANTNINQDALKNLSICFPPSKVEQDAIAEGLTNADALIESLENLIEKKRQIKQGAMQELLTGKKRLAGFGGEWRRKLWGDVILSCGSGATPYRGSPEYYKGNIKWITSGELNYKQIDDTFEHISEEAVVKTNLKTHPKGTFLMAITGLEAAGTRGSCGIVGSPATTNQSCMAIYPSSEMLTKYLFHYYVFKGGELALKYCQGTKQQSYTAQLVRILPIELPSTTEEQSVIADTLSDMDDEIELLEVKLSKARKIKDGMMQELLTGRIRLV